MTRSDYIRWFEDLSVSDVSLVGGKNASLGELIGALKSAGVRVPGGFATTAGAYWAFLDANGLRAPIESLLADLTKERRTLQEAGTAIRDLLLGAKLPDVLAEAILAAYRDLSRRYGSNATDVAVRSSATAEDLPGASFAGQHETFLNVLGEDNLLEACRRCYASLFTDRAINYRDQQGFEHMKIALSVGVQKMVRSDKAGAGVMFSIDTETGFPRAVIINAAWGLGETVVQGLVTPDEYIVFKPALANPDCVPIIEKEIGDKKRKLVYSQRGTLSTRLVSVDPDDRTSSVLADQEIVQLARWACAIEKHYGVPMDIEWAKDGDSGDLFIVQARPETVQSRREGTALRTYTLKQRGKRLLQGLAIGDAIAGGHVSVILDAREMSRFRPGSILVTGSTNPDWVPIMKKASGLVTDHGGRTSHAAIVSRELGLPAVVGTGNATSTLVDGRLVTISCAEGEEGYVYEGALPFETHEERLDNVPDTRVRMMINVANPVAAFRWWRLPVKGIGLARMEFIIDNIIKIHPMALLRFEALTDQKAKRQIERLTAGYEDKAEYFVDRLARGIARIAASQHPHPVIVRMSDFKTNEYADLIGGREFEPHEENPMIGFRGACRYYSESYREGFALECRAVARARGEIGLTNIIVMIPFCRTVEEGRRVLAVMEQHGLRRGEDGLEVYVMAEIPSNIILAEQFAEIFDGFSIGSNDLTQLVLGVDRDSEELSYLFEERNEAIKRMIADLIQKAHRAGRKVGICGQAPSDHPDFAVWLARQGIDSMSLNPDSVIKVIEFVAEAESARKGPA
jgi:pyruvate,water dikinase